MIKAWNRKEIVERWNAGVSAARIVEELKLDITVRQVQRIGAEHGDRRLRASGRLGIDDGSRGGILGDVIVQLMIARGDDPYVCALCGAVSEGQRQTIHHTKYEGATLADLVFACWSCQHQFDNHGLA